MAVDKELVSLPNTSINIISVNTYTNSATGPNKFDYSKSKEDEIAKFIGFPYIKNIDNDVIKELNKRSQISDRLNIKSPWVRITSGAQEINKSGEISNSFMFIEGTLNGQKGNPYIDDGRPYTGVTGLEVKYYGKYGGTKKATYKISVWSEEEFQKITPYFVTNGVTNVIEWGFNDPSIVGNSNVLSKILINNYVDENFVRNQNSYFDKMKKLSNYNYDGMLGIITKYDISIVGVGKYEISVTVNSIGSLFYGVNLTNQATPLGEPKNNYNDEYIKTIRNFIDSSKLEDIVTRDSVWITDVTNDLPGAEQKNIIKVGMSKNESTGKSTRDIYYSWSFIEDKIINDNIGLLSNGKKFFEINSYGIRISASPSLISTDHTVGFFIPNNFYPTEPNDDYGNTGFIRRIFIHENLVKSAFKNINNLSDAILSILDKVSGAFFNFWKFSLRNIDNTNLIVVTDENMISNSNLKDSNIYTFKWGSESILLDTNVSFNSSNAVALNTLYNKNKNQDDLNPVLYNDNFNYFNDIFDSEKNKIYFDVFFSKLNYDDEKIKIKNDKKIGISLNGTAKALFNAGLYYPGEDDLIKRKIFSGSTNGLINSRTFVLPPIEFNIKILGISGIRSGDVFLVDALPREYKNNGVLQVKYVEHEIDNSNWITNINVLYRCIDYNKKVTNIKINAPSNETVESPFNNSIKSSKKNTEVNINEMCYEEETQKFSIVLHHTAGYGVDNAINTFKQRNLDEGPVATQYIVDYNGSVKNVYDDKYWANNSSRGGNRAYKDVDGKKIYVGGNPHTIGIEMISIGWFEGAGAYAKNYEQASKANSFDKIPDGTYFLYFPTNKYYGHTYIPMFTKSQFLATYRLIKQMCDKYNIPKKVIFTGYKFDSKLISLTSGLKSLGAGIVRHGDIYQGKVAEITPGFNLHLLQKLLNNSLNESNVNDYLNIKKQYTTDEVVTDGFWYNNCEIVKLDKNKKDFVKIKDI